MNDIESIGIEFDTSGLEKGEAAMRRVEQQGYRTGDAADSLGAGFKKLSDQEKDAIKTTDQVIEKLKRQAETFGMNAEAMRRYELAQLRGTQAQKDAITQYLRQIEAQERSADRMRKLQGDAQAFGRAFTIAWTAVQTGAVAALAAIDHMIDKVGSFQDLAEKMGSNDPAGLTSMRTAADITGVSLEQVGLAANRLSINLAKVDDEGKGAGKALAAIGLDVEKFKRMAPEDQIREVAKALSGYKDSASKAAVMNALFGRGGAQLLPFLKELGSETEKVTYLTNAQIKAADDYSDANAKAMSIIKQQVEVISLEALPTMVAFKSAIYDTIEEMFGLGKESTALGGNTGLNTFAQNAAKVLGFLVDMVDGVIRAFRIVGKTIAANVASAIDMFTSVGEAVYKFQRFDFSGAFAAVKGGVEKQKAIWSGYAEEVQEIMLAPTFGSKLQARLDAVNTSEQKVTDAHDRHLKDREISYSAVNDKKVKNEKKVVDEFLKLYGELSAKEAGVSPDFLKKLNLLFEGFQKGRISLEQYTKAAEFLINQQPYMTAQTKQLAKENDEAAKAYEHLLEASQKAGDQLLDEVEKQKLHNASIGQTKEAIAELESVRLEALASSKDRRAAVLDEIDWSGQLGNAYRNEADRLRELAGLKRTGGMLETADDTMKDIDKFLDPKKAESFGDALKGAFKGAGDAMVQLLSTFESYGQKQAEIAEMQTKLANTPGISAEKRIKAEMELSKRSVALQVKGLGEMAGASKNFFKQHTGAYKLLDTIEKATHAWRMVTMGVEYAQKLGLITATTAATITGNTQQAASAVAGAATEVGAKQAIAGSNAVAAVSNQGNGDPYTAFFRIAAMAAIMAGMGLMTGGGGGGGGGVPISRQRQDGQGTGSVFGDEQAKSESLANSMSVLSDNSNIALKYTSEMLRTLHSINDGIAGMVNTVVRATGLRGTRLDELAAGVGSKRGFLGFSSSSTELVDQGIDLGTHSIGEIRDRGGLPDAMKYSEIERKSSTLFGLIKSSSLDTVFEKLDDTVTAQLTRTIFGVIDGIEQTANQFGIKTETITEKINGYVLSVGKISLKGLTGTEIQSELEAVFGAMADGIAEAVVPGLQDFRKVGEGYFETIVRVASGTENAQLQLERFNLTAVDYTEIVRKQGDVGAEIVRQTIMTNESLAGVRDMMSTLEGTASELADTYGSLLSVSSSLQAVGISGETLTRSLVRGAGGVDNLQSSLDSFFEDYFDDSEKLAAKTAQMTAQFAALGYALPASMAMFKTMVRDIPKGTEEGQLLLGKLLQLGTSFADLSSMVEDAAEAVDTLDQIMESLVSRKGSLEVELLKAKGDKTGARSLQRALDTVDYTAPQLAAYDYNQALQDQVDLLHEAAAATEAEANQRYGLETRLLQLQGNTTELRRRELEKLVPANRATQELIWSLEDAASAGTALATATKTATEAVDKARTTLLGAYDRESAALKQVIEDSQKRVDEARSAVISSYQSESGALQDTIDKHREYARSLREARDAMLLSANSPLSRLARTSTARRLYDQALSQARSGNMNSGIEGAGNSYLGALQSSAKTRAEFNRGFALVASGLTEAANGADATADVTKIQLDVITAQFTALGLTTDKAVTFAEAQVEYLAALNDSSASQAQAQLDVMTQELEALGLINQSVVSYGQALQAYLGAQAAKDQAESDQAAPSAPDGNSASLPVEPSTPSSRPRTYGNPGNLLMMYQGARAAGITLAQLDSDSGYPPGTFTTWAKQNNLPTFARGGYHLGGARIVGDGGGPELEVTGPSRIHSTDKLRSLFTGGESAKETVVEIRKMREQGFKVQIESLVVLQKVRTVLEKIDALGLGVRA